MASSLLDKSNTTILVVESASSVRLMIMGLLRNFGYERIHGVSSCKDAIAVLESESVQWMITPLHATDEINAMHLIQLITSEPKLSHVATTLLLDAATEDYCLPLAFEMGLLSWHQKAYVKDSLQASLEEFFAIFSSHKENVTLTSAEYLRRYLTDKRMSKSRLALEQTLLSLYPGSTNILVQLAEAELLSGGENRAVGLLKQAEMIDESMLPLCQKIREKYAKGIQAASAEVHENVLGIRSVFVVDPDTDVLYAASDMLKKMGIDSVETFENGEQALAAILASGKEPDLILMEWRIPGLSGPVLVQRIRQADLLQVPIIVASSLIKKEESPLLMEMGVDCIIEKPFDQKAFYSAIVWAVQQNRTPTEQKSLERKIRRLLAAQKLPEAERLLSHLLGDARMSDGAKSGIKAEYCFAVGDYKGACSHGINSLRLGGDTLALLNLVGKSLLKLKQYERALACFEKANAMCSINLERLMNIAEINLQLGNAAGAHLALGSATALDASNAQTKDMQVKVGLETGHPSVTEKSIKDLESVPRIASYINNRAIALARSGRFEDGIALYERAIQCLSGGWKDLAASVRYNLGLAYARYGDYEKALQVLMMVCSDTDVPVFKKALNLTIRIEDSLKTGNPLVFDTSHDDHPSPESNDVKANESSANAAIEKMEFTASTLTAKRGDIGCYLVFYLLEEHDARSRKLLENAPHFMARGAVGSRADDASGRKTS